MGQAGALLGGLHIAGSLRRGRARQPLAGAAQVATGRRAAGGPSEQHLLDSALACPICRGPLSVACECDRCRVAFRGVQPGNYLDLTTSAAKPVEDLAGPAVEAEAAGGRSPKPNEGAPRSSGIPPLGRYDRGWNEGFEVNGFPGPDEEHRLAKAFLEAALGGLRMSRRILLDCSCGSGLFTRRFAADASSGFAGVLALDISEGALLQSDAYAAGEAGPAYGAYPWPLRLLRGDACRLPLRDGSVAGVHAAAAIHCWASPEKALAEAARVLEPGGALVLSTFRGGAVGHVPRPWEAEELRALTRRVGLSGFEAVQRDPAFIMVKAEKSERAQRTRGVRGSEPRASPRTLGAAARPRCEQRAEGLSWQHASPRQACRQSRKP